MQTNQHTTLNDIVPYKKVPEKFPDLFTHESWIWAVRRRKKNGLEPAFRNIGKQLFVNLHVLAECIDKQNKSELKSREE